MFWVIFGDGGKRSVATNTMRAPNDLSPQDPTKNLPIRWSFWVNCYIEIILSKFWALNITGHPYPLPAHPVITELLILMKSDTITNSDTKSDTKSDFNSYTKSDTNSYTNSDTD